MKLNYIIIPLSTIITSWAGSFFTSKGINSGWYDGILKPAWTPGGGVIGAVWTIIFILSTVSALIVWNKMPRPKKFNSIFFIFALNAILNIFWSFLFFGNGLIGTAAIETAILGATVLALVILIWPVSKIASSLLIPYAGWVAFASYLTYRVWTLN